MKKTAFLLAILALAGCSGTRRGDGSREVTVEAEGWGVLAGQNLLTAKHRALAEAQKKAVEKAVGVTVRANTRVEDALSVKQSIEANLGGTIRRYTVLSEAPEGDFYKVRIAAVVIYRPQELSKKTRATRFSVRLADERVASALRLTLIAHDFPLGESETDADVVVAGVVETYGRSDLRLSGFHSRKASVTLSVADVRSGRTEETTCDGSALDMDSQAASDEALEQAGRNCGLALAAMFSKTLTAASD